MRARLFAAALLLSGCSLAPDYRAPAVPSPATFKEGGIWRVGMPSDAVPRGTWWALYGDATLDGLEQKVDSGNPTLADALAHYDTALGYLQQFQAGQYPTLDAGGHANTDKQSANRPLRSASQPTYYGDNLLGVTLSWDVDLFGRLRNQAAAGAALAEGASAEFAAVRLSLQARLAGAYIALRGQDRQAQLLRDAITIYSKALTVTDARHDKGVASGLDVSRARTQLSDARAQLSDVLARRAQLEHAIASLVGVPASTFEIAVSTEVPRLPQVPADVPSTLLQRRPDIASAERLVAATNAQIGVARAAFYPDISLSALAGFQNTGSDSLLNASNTLWALGPSVAMTLFDAGRHEGQLAVAKAQNLAAAAEYRATVLQAFQEVEDNLALLDHLAQEAQDKADSVSSATRTQDLALALYQNGALAFLDVVVAQTTALQAQQAALAIETGRLEASVNLIHALGGGWSRQEMPHLTDSAAVTDRPS
jgi:NodT family efflux transporter outer membrane factor (OMF) lipoprotein